ncbi:MAG: class I tRNA ligase family protein, partial [Treponema maltophilum]
MKGIELEKAYNPKDFEERLYNRWETEGCFKPELKAGSGVNNGAQKPFTVGIPPPNVTGILHRG